MRCASSFGDLRRNVLGGPAPFWERARSRLLRGLIYAGAVTSEPDARADLEPRLALRERAIRLVGEAVRPRLKAGLTQDDAVAILSALTIPEVYRDLVRDRGWTPDRYQQWVGRTLTEQLLTSPRGVKPNVTP